MSKTLLRHTLIKKIFLTFFVEATLSRNERGRFGALKSDSPTISLEIPVPSQGHYGFHSFAVVD
jgi:hypothetical protein